MNSLALLTEKCMLQFSSPKKVKVGKLGPAQQLMFLYLSDLKWLSKESTNSLQCSLVRKDPEAGKD